MSIWNGAFDKLFIGGKWVAPRTTSKIEVISPFSEEPVASVPAASRGDVDAAVAAARLAFDGGPWSEFTLEQRVELVERLKAAFEVRHEALSQTITTEMGSPITQSRTIQTVVPVRMLEAHIEIAQTYPWRAIRRTRLGSSLVQRRGKGVVAMIVPWNAPMMATITKLGPALLSGCTVVLKPAPESPLSAYMLAEMIEEAGFPGGVVNVLPADREESEYLALHPGVDKVSFTGSTVAGRHLASRCGDLLRPITLELGGKSAGIILDDADLEQAVESLRLGSFRNSGQICSLKTRLLVPTAREGELLERIADLMDSMPVGDPQDPSTHIGPMVSRRQRDRVESYIQLGIDEGAKVVRGGIGRPEAFNHGWFVKPTVFASVDPEWRIAQEEVFGPVLTVSTYSSEDEAIQIANNSDYGLSGAVFSADIDRAVQIASRIHTGVVEINGSGTGPFGPFGGVKQSGLGREGGPEGFDPYVEIQAIGLPEQYALGLE